MQRGLRQLPTHGLTQTLGQRVQAGLRGGGLRAQAGVTLGQPLQPPAGLQKPGRCAPDWPAGLDRAGAIALAGAGAGRVGEPGGQGVQRLHAVAAGAAWRGAGAARAAPARPARPGGPGTPARPPGGVGARRSATKSAMVKSVSAPHAADGGIGQAASARATVSSLNAHKSSMLPPPRQTISTSTSGAAPPG